MVDIIQMFRKLIGKDTEEELASAQLEGFANLVRRNSKAPSAVLDGLAYMLPALIPDNYRNSFNSKEDLSNFVRESIRVNTDFDHATDFQFDAPYKRDAPVVLPIESPLYEWDYGTRRYIAEQCHAAYRRNPDARALHHIANFAISGGFNLTTYNPLIADTLNEFIDHPENRIREYERQAAIDLLVDGELLLRWYERDFGLIVVPKQPYELYEIKTEIGHYRKMESFTFIESQDDGRHWEFEQKFDPVPAEDILFVAINNHAYELRGRSELYPILVWLKARKDWLENRARINYWKSVILWHISVGTNQMKQLNDVRARWSKPPPPGSISIESEAVQVNPVHAVIGADDAKDDGRQLLLQIAKGFMLPEYFLSDGHNANLATATRQQMPALARFEAHQFVLVNELWMPMFRKVISHAVDAGYIPQYVQKHDGAGNPLEEEILAVDAFEVSYPPVGEIDMLAQSNALAIQLANELISLKQARMKLGLDSDAVEADLEDEKDAFARDARRGLAPLPPEDDEDEEEEPEEEDDE